jgi:elongation factor Ts
MAEITATMVKDLRERTDAPMMDCKKALTDAGGHMEKAEEILRVKFGSRASKAAGRVTAEGVVGVHISADGKRGAIVEVNCETDFVARNDDFLAFSGNLARLVAENKPADVAALSALPLDGKTVEERRTELVGRIGENMSIRRFVRIEAQGRLVSYIHGGAKIGVLADVTGDETLARDIAMHIAASKPVSLSRDQVPAELIEKERSVATQKAAESGKPADIVAKMVEGAVSKYLKEVTLLSQPFVKDDKQTVEQLLKAKGAQVHEFTLYVVGEGLVKRKDDFVAEVMAQASQA